MPLHALISDIHGNIDALNAVLSDIENQKADNIVCLGDMIGYGGAPGACLRSIRDRCSIVLMGNHEAFTFMPFDIDQFSPRVGRGIEKAREELTPEEIDWISQLPIISELDGTDLVHASLDTPVEFHHVLSKRDAKQHFSFQKTSVCFNGHTHIPAVFKQTGPKVEINKPLSTPTPLDKNCRYLINVGSVGQPRDGDNRACYVLFDSESLTITYRRIPYDIEAAQQRFQQAEMHPSVWKRIAKGT